MNAETIKMAVEALEKEMETTRERLKMLEGNLWSYRQLCPHGGWKDAGSDSHYDYEKCGFCGEIRKK